MREPLYWDDAYPIALKLQRKHPSVEPSQVTYAQLRAWVMQLENFADDAREAHEERLEDIQREWLDLK